MLDGLGRGTPLRRGCTRAGDPHGRRGQESENAHADATQRQHARSLRVCLRGRQGCAHQLRIGNAHGELQRGGRLNLVELRVGGMVSLPTWNVPGAALVTLNDSSV